MVREALFSILGDAVPDRPFFDLFAGTGAIGLEAVSRGAAPVTFVERDVRTASEIEHHVREFRVEEEAVVVRADAYRWAEHWPGALEPVNVFVGPPYRDLERRPDAILSLIAELQQKLAPGSVLVVQAEPNPALEKALPNAANWKVRRYGRNMLLIWLRDQGSGIGGQRSGQDPVTPGP
jgi:16S rRNA (guanine(966)-N(2))-methyltransferase RsmD